MHYGYLIICEYILVLIEEQNKSMYVNNNTRDVVEIIRHIRRIFTYVHAEPPSTLVPESDFLCAYTGRQIVREKRCKNLRKQLVFSLEKILRLI